MTAITDLNVTNQAVSTLAANVLAGDGTISVQPGDGNLKFPTTGGGKYFMVVVVKADKTYEIMKCTSRAADTLTVTRAQEGTSALGFSSGDAVGVRFTAGNINDLIAAVMTKAGGTFTGTVVLNADPVNPLEAATKQYVDTQANTGDVKLTMKTTADSGWIMMNDGSIGDAASGATTRANADTSALFTLLWTNTSNADCPVSGGRGGSAAADFAAHKTLTMPKGMGRAFAMAGAGAGLTSRTLGNALGAETSSHHHGPGSLIGTVPTQLLFADGGTRYAPNYTTTAPVTLTGGVTADTAPSVMQPTTFVNAMIKL